MAHFVRRLEVDAQVKRSVLGRQGTSMGLEVSLLELVLCLELPGFRTLH